MILLRLIPTSVHTLSDVEQTIKAFSEVRAKLAEGAYRVDEGILSAKNF